MSIFKLIWSNIKKRKGASITFFSMTLIAALMLSVSLSLTIGGTDFYEKKVNSLNAPHYTSMIVSSAYRDEFTSFATSYNETTEFFKVSTIMTSNSVWKFDWGETANSTSVFDFQEFNLQSFFHHSIIDSQPLMTDDSIILPISFRTNVSSGQKLTLSVNSVDYSFTVFGFFEDTIAGSSVMGMNLVFVPSQRFEQLTSEGNFINFTCMFLRFTDSSISRSYASAFKSFAGLDGNAEFTITYDVSQSSATMFITILSLILTAFSLIILTIAFIVASFSIINSIYEDIFTIGALKSMGYKNRKLKATRIVEFVLIAALGSLVGSLISLFSFGFLGNIIAGTSGLLWLSDSNILPLFLSIFIISGLTLIVTFFSVLKYKQITPVRALREGECSSNYKRVSVPLDKYKMPLDVHLGIKRLFSLIKNNLTLAVVVSLLVFISVLVNSVSYNLNTDRSAMIQMVGLEMAEIYVQATPENDIYQINDEIKTNADVNFTLLTGSKNCIIEDFDTYISTVEDYSALTIDTLITGRHPTEENEITLGGVTAKALNKGMGDKVSVEIDGITKLYTVVGITQNIANGGDGSAVAYAAMLNHSPQFRMDTIYVYLNDGVDTDQFHSAIKATYGNRILTVDTESQMDTILSSLGDPFMAVSMVMIVATIAIIAFVLFLIISAMIRKQKKELGIMKAIGFKNSRLILQTIIAFLPSLIIGTVLGIIMGFLLTNPLISALFTTAGLLKSYFIIPTLSSIFIGIAILIISIFISYIISLRLKRISPQRLIKEQ